MLFLKKIFFQVKFIKVLSLIPISFLYIHFVSANEYKFDDIKFDKERGYIYLPQEELRRFNYSEKDLIAEKYNEAFVEFMRFQTKRARSYYHSARKYLRPDEKQTIVAAEIMDSIYFRLLEKIELNELDIFKFLKINTKT